MVAPLVLAGSVAGSIILDYGIQKMQGDKYTAQDAVTAGALGALPAARLAGPAGKIFTNLRHLSHYSRKHGDTIGGAFYVMGAMNKPHIQQIAIGSIRTQLVKGGIDYAFEQTSRGRGQSLTSRPRTPRQPQPKRSMSAGKRTFPPRPSKGGNENGRARRRTTYCNLHKKYDFCEYYKK